MSFARLTRNQHPDESRSANFLAAIDTDTQPSGWFPGNSVPSGDRKLCAFYRAAWSGARHLHARAISRYRSRAWRCFLYREYRTAAQNQSAGSLSITRRKRAAGATRSFRGLEKPHCGNNRCAIRAASCVSRFSSCISCFARVPLLDFLFIPFAWRMSRD